MLDSFGGHSRGRRGLHDRVPLGDRVVEAFIGLVVLGGLVIAARLLVGRTIGDGGGVVMTFGLPGL